MQIYFRLHQYLSSEDQKKTYGRLAKKFDLPRHQLQHLLNNDSPMISRNALAKVCQYLVDNNLVDRADLPGALFAFEAESFWRMLNERQRIAMFMGVRHDQARNDHLVVAADSILQATLLHEATTTGPLKHRQRQVITAQLIPAWQHELDDQAVIRNSRNEFRKFTQIKGDKGLVLFGSTKSNPLIELLSASMFCRARAFRAQEDVKQPQQRHCPFYYFYRDQDPQPDSCCGGRKLSVDQPGKSPGMYFEDEDGVWQHIPCDEENDSALLLYRFQKSLGRLDVICGGFSGRGTRCLAQVIQNGEAIKWCTPVVSTDDEETAALIVHFKFRTAKSKSKSKSKSKPKTGQQTPWHRRITKTQFYSLSESALTDRLRALST